jgi:hypothetical protein
LGRGLPNVGELASSLKPRQKVSVGTSHFAKKLCFIAPRAYWYDFTYAFTWTYLGLIKNPKKGLVANLGKSLWNEREG